MLVNWTNEEGSRFAPAMLGSGVYAGRLRPRLRGRREDRQGVTFAEAIEGIGYRGDAAPGSVTFGAMFELHIEQGPILEAEEKTIGVVTGVQGMRWYEVELDGREAHTGLDADEPAPQRAPRRGAARRAGRRDRARACAVRGRHRRPRRGEAELAQRDSRPRLLHRRFPASGRCGARRDGAQADGGGAGRRRAIGLDYHAAQGLGFAGRALRSGLHRGGARRHREGGLSRRATWSRAPATTPPTSPASRRRR